MSPFWNHILANLADLSMWLLKSRGTSAVCTWGLWGVIFQTYTFCARLPQCCVLLCGSHFLPTYCTNSNTPFQNDTCALAASLFGMTTCALVTSAPRQQPSAITTMRRLSLYHSTHCTWLHTSDQSTPHTSIATIEFITLPLWLKVPPPQRQRFLV